MVVDTRDAREADVATANRPQPNPSSGRGRLVLSQLPRRQTRNPNLGRVRLATTQGLSQSSLVGSRALAAAFRHHEITQERTRADGMLCQHFTRCKRNEATAFAFSSNTYAMIRRTASRLRNQLLPVASETSCCLQKCQESSAKQWPKQLPRRHHESAIRPPSLSGLPEACVSWRVRSDSGFRMNA